LCDQAHILEIVHPLFAEASVFPLQPSAASRAVIGLICRMLAQVNVTGEST
jgi:hypothetical protein